MKFISTPGDQSESPSCTTAQCLLRNLSLTWNPEGWPHVPLAGTGLYREIIHNNNQEKNLLSGFGQSSISLAFC